MNLLEDAGIAPAAEVLPNELPGRQIMGQESPGAARTGLIEDGIPDLAPWPLGRASALASLGGRKNGLDGFPLGIGHVGRVGFAFHNRFLPIQRYFLYSL